MSASSLCANIMCFAQCFTDFFNEFIVNMLISFTKLNTLILIFNALHLSIRLALKNRKRIDEMENFCNMFAFISYMSLVCSLNINDVSLFLKSCILI